MENYKNKQILITGGTGSFGNAFIKHVIKQKYKVKRLVIFSRDEFKQSEMQKKYPIDKYPFIRFFIGDVRDKERLGRALENIDYVIHAAALKHVHLGEYNPMEVIKTNVIGAQNIVDMCLDNNIKNVIALSTDKASSPINLYGATKLCSDKLFIAANNYSGLKSIFSVVRYGNVMNSRGSVIPFFLKMNKSNSLNITDKKMTRFNITLKEGVNFVLQCLKESKGGEIFVPKLPSYRIMDLAKAISPKARIKLVGKRPGEKIDEEMITSADSVNSLEFKNHYIIFASNKSNLYLFYKNKKRGKILPPNFSYNSKNNKFLTVAEIKNLIKNTKYA